MAANLGAKAAEKVIGHGDQNRAARTDIANPDREGGKYADPSGEKMKALVWMGKNDVRVGEDDPINIQSLTVADRPQQLKPASRLSSSLMMPSSR